MGHVLEKGEPLERGSDTAVPTEANTVISDEVMRLCIALPVDEAEAARDEARILAEDAEQWAREGWPMVRK
jgi:hypothetical protein